MKRYSTPCVPYMPLSDESTMSDAISEVEHLNPHFRWNWRKIKRIIKWRAAQLTPGISYALGCSGHPGLVISRRYWPNWGVGDLMGADIEIKSLVDGHEESCSIFHCAPEAISRAEAMQRAEYMRTHHSFDVSIRYGGFSPEEIKRDYWDYWINKGSIYYVLSDHDGQTSRSGAVMNKEDAEQEVARLSMGWAVENGITNPRIVDFRTYPAPPTLLEL